MDSTPDVHFLRRDTEKLVMVQEEPWKEMPDREIWSSIYLAHHKDSSLALPQEKIPSIKGLLILYRRAKLEPMTGAEDKHTEARNKA